MSLAVSPYLVINIATMSILGIQHTHDYKKVHKIVLHHIPPWSKTNRRLGSNAKIAQCLPESYEKVSFNSLLSYYGT